jgi:hypothetical protein
MDRVIVALPFVVAMFVGMLICLEIGRTLGKRALAKDPQLMSTHNVVDGAVFALYGLLLAFTFSGAPGRLDKRRELVAVEANAIGTAYLRLDLLAPESQPAIREQFRTYLDTRISAYRKLPDIEAAEKELAVSASLQKEIWAHAIQATRMSTPHPEAGKLLLPALNEMFDVTATRTMAARVHPPAIIYGLLFVIALVCSLLAGYGMAVSKQRSWLHILAFTSVAVITVFVVLELEYPRIGFLSVENRYDQLLVDLRQSMNE